jgi:hypothetical protein
VVLPSGDALAPTTFYERMAQTAAERYFDSTGSVTAGLREMINYLNQNLMEYNQARKEHAYEANLLCAVLRGDDLIVARVGSGVVALRHQGRLETSPSDLSNDEALFSAPLGVRPIPDIKMSRHKVASGTRLVLSDSNIADFTRDSITEALLADEISMVLVKFRELARLQLTLLAVEFVPPEAASPGNAREGTSSIEVTEAMRTEAARSKTTPDGQPARARRNPLGKTGARIGGQIQAGLGRIAHSIARVLRLSNRTIEHYFGAPEDGKRRWYTLPIATGVAVLLPVIVVGLVVVLWVGQTGESRYEQCIDQALALANTAREAASDNPANRLTLWNTAMNAAVQCEPLRPGDPLIAELVREGQLVIDIVNEIERREAILMDARQGASYNRIVVDGFDMFLLDSTNGIVYEAIISEVDGLSFFRKPSPIPSMRTGENVNGYEIGRLIDITFSRTDDQIFALDANGVLIRCKRRLTQDCETERLLNFEAWQRPAALGMYDDRLYVLDPDANQIWRYDRSGGGYSVSRAAEYFQGRNVGNASVTTAIDFAIDVRGIVYVLLSDGTMLRYQSGERIDFVYADFPSDQAISSAQAMFLDDSPLGDGIYIVNRSNRTIYEISKGGTRRSSFRVFDETVFSTLSGAVADAGLGVIYAISGNSVFALQKAAPSPSEATANLP